MAGKPIIEEGLLDVTRGMHLKFEPGFSAVVIDVHGDVIGLTHPSEPMALQTPAINQTFVKLLHLKMSYKPWQHFEHVRPFP